MTEIPFKWVGDRMIVLTGVELEEYHAREVAAVERRKNQVVEKTEADRIAELEVDNELLKARLDAIEAKQQ